MLFYYIVWMALCFFGFLNIRKKELKIFFYMFLIFLCLMTGFRYKISGDWYNYIDVYNYYYNVDFFTALKITDPGYGVVNYFSQIFSIEGTILVNFICSILFYIFFFKFTKKIDNYWIPLLIAFPYCIVVVSMGYTRQSVAIGFVLLSVMYALDKKIGWYLFCCLFAFMFHKTAIVSLIFLPFILTPSKFNSNLNFYGYSLFSCLLITGLLYISTVSGDNMYTDQSGDMTSAGALFRISFHFLTLFFYFFYRKNIVVMFPKFYRIFDYMAILVIFTFLLAFPFSTLADRFNLYLIMFDIFVFSYLYGTLNKFNRNTMIFSIIIVNTAMFSIWLNLGVWAGAWLPYQNYITNFLFELF